MATAIQLLAIIQIAMEEKLCSICNIQIQENYCSRCGQKISSKKLSVFLILSDFFSNFFSMNKSGFSTLLKVIANPGKIVNNYLVGYRNYYTSPGKILLYGIVALTLHMILVEESAMDFKVGEKSLKAQYGFLLVSYPYLMLVSHLSFLRRKLNFAQHFISIIYTATSLLVLIILAMDMAYLISGKLLEMEAFCIFIVFTFFWNSRVFSKKKTFLALLANTFLQAAVFTAIIAIIYGLNLIGK